VYFILDAFLTLYFSFPLPMASFGFRVLLTLLNIASAYLGGWLYLKKNKQHVES
jgi:hypothetical protein